MKYQRTSPAGSSTSKDYFRLYWQNDIVWSPAWNEVKAQTSAGERWFHPRGSGWAGVSDHRWSEMVAGGHSLAMVLAVSRRR